MPNPTGATIEPLKALRQDQATEYGYATVLWLRPRIESFRAAREVAAVFEGSRRGHLLAKKEETIHVLAGAWFPQQPVQVALDRTYDSDQTVNIASTAGDGSLRAKASFTITSPREIHPLRSP